MYSKFLLLIISCFALVAVTVSLPANGNQKDEIASLADVNSKSHSILVDIPTYTTDASGNIIPNGTVSGNAELRCETSGGSPWVWDINAAANQLRGDRMCQQTNGIGSHCKELSRYEMANIAICGVWLAHTKCNAVGLAADHIASRCVWNDRAGGKWRFPDINIRWLDTIVY